MCAIDRGFYGIFDSNIALGKKSFPSASANFRGDFFSLRALDIGQSNSRAFASEESRDAFTHSGGCAADPCHLIRESGHASKDVESGENFKGEVTENQLS